MDLATQVAVQRKNIEEKYEREQLEREENEKKPAKEEHPDANTLHNTAKKSNADATVRQRVQANLGKQTEENKARGLAVKNVRSFST
jgi:hypothetical protein